MRDLVLAASVCRRARVGESRRRDLGSTGRAEGTDPYGPGARRQSARHAYGADGHRRRQSRARDVSFWIRRVGRDAGSGGPVAPPSTSAPPAPSSPARSGDHINPADTNPSPTGASVTRPVDLRGSPRSSPKPGPTSRVFRMGRPVPGGLRVRKRAGGRARPSGPVRAPLGAARADLALRGMSAGSPSRAATTVRCAPMGEVSTGMTQG